MQPTAQGHESQKILVVDDNAASAQTMAMLLQMAGHNVVVAETGGEAIQECARFDPDVVLLDIGLPDINGHEVAKRIREHFGSAAPLLVAVTGWEREDMHPGCGDCIEFDLFLTKPVNYDDLERLLQRNVSRGGDVPIAT